MIKRIAIALCTLALVASDKEHDLAILKIIDKSFNGFGNIPYGIRTDGAEVGDEIFVLGYPMTQPTEKNIIDLLWELKRE